MPPPPLIPDSAPSSPAPPQAPRILIYADSGYGKSTLAAALMRLLAAKVGRPAIYCDWDNGDGDLIGDKRAYRLHWAPAGPPRLAIDEAQESIETALRERVSAYVVDTVSIMGRAIWYDCPAPPKSDMPFDYGRAQVQFDQWVLGTFRLTRAGIPVLLIAHEKVAEIKNARGAVSKVRGGPSVIGNQTIQTLPGAMNIVYRLAVEPVDNRVTRVLIPDATDEMFIAKDRPNAFSQRRRVRIGVSPFVDEDEKKGTKERGAFEEECLQMGEKVWRTVFQAIEQRAQEKAVVRPAPPALASPAPAAAPTESTSASVRATK